MSDAYLNKYTSLPDELKKEVNSLIDSLFLKNKKSKKEKKKKEGPKYGFAKGMFKMSKDFDEPLEDFNEYMY